MTDLENLKPCPFCGSKIKHVESWAKSFDPPRLYHEWHHVENENCWIRNNRGLIVANSNEKPNSIQYAVETWNARSCPKNWR